MEAIALGHDSAFAGRLIELRSEAVPDLGLDQAVEVALELADAVGAQHRVAVGDDLLLILAENGIWSRQARSQGGEENPPAAANLVGGEHDGAAQFVRQDQLEDPGFRCLFHVSNSSPSEAEYPDREPSRPSEDLRGGCL